MGRRTINSSLYTFIYGQIEPEFHISREVATLGLSLFVMGLATGPLFLAPLSEVVSLHTSNNATAMIWEHGN